MRILCFTYCQILLLTALFSMPVTEVAALEENDLYHMRIVQTLIDTDAGRKSSGHLYVKESDIKKHMIHRKHTNRTFAISSNHTSSPIRTEYRIVLSQSGPKTLSKSYWKKLITSDRLSGASFWGRKAEINGESCKDVIGRIMLHGALFEAHFTFLMSDPDKNIILKKFRFFLDNAEKNGVLSEAEDQALPGTGLKEHSRSRIFGTWEGEMRNTRGERIKSSRLVLEPGLKDTIAGTWHAGWPLENVKKKDDLLTWEHKNLRDGCRDYKVTVRFSKKPDKAILFYEVRDSCRLPAKYSGAVKLDKVK